MAAGLGFKEFTTGDVLTAADANGYLASQVVMVFADAAARTTAITSPQEGMIVYLKDTNAVEKYDGAAWVAVAGSSASGLTLISATACAAVASQAVTGFSATYENYRIIIAGDGTNNDSVHMKLRSTATDSSTAYYYYGQRFFSSNAVQAVPVANGTAGFEVAMAQTASSGVIDVIRPYEAKRTSIFSTGIQFDTGATRSVSVYNAGVHNIETSYDGFNIIWASGTFTGTIYLYGYQES